MADVTPHFDGWIGPSQYADYPVPLLRRRRQRDEIPPKAFGFRRFGAVSRGPDGKINHAAMKAGSSVVLMGRPPAAYRNPRRLGQATQCLLLDVRGVDAHFQRALGAGARVLQEPADTPFGTRRYGVTDPEGHEWYFTQRRRTKRAASR